jgi:hypothetical protein
MQASMQVGRQVCNKVSSADLKLRRDVNMQCKYLMSISYAHTIMVAKLVFVY